MVTVIYNSSDVNIEFTITQGTIEKKLFALTTKQTTLVDV